MKKFVALLWALLRSVSVHWVWPSMLLLACEAPPRLIVVDNPNRLVQQLGDYPGTFIMTRDATGTEIRFLSTINRTTILVSAQASVVTRRPTTHSFPISQEEFGEFPELDEYFSEDPDTVAELRRDPMGRTGVDFSGRYFFVVARGTLVGVIGDPSKPRGQFPILANGIFTKGDEIYLCGRLSEMRNLATTCRVLSRTDSGFEQQDTFVIPCCPVVVDVDPYSENILATAGDLMPTWYIHNRHTGESSPIGLFTERRSFSKKDSSNS